MSVCLNKALDRACRRFDADGSGTISRAELTRALRSLGVPVRTCAVPGASRLCWRRFVMDVADGDVHVIVSM